MSKEHRPPAIGLVVISGGVGEAYTPAHVDVRIVDLDDLDADPSNPTQDLPLGIGFEELARDADISDRVRFVENVGVPAVQGGVLDYRAQGLTYDDYVKVCDQVAFELKYEDDLAAMETPQVSVGDYGTWVSIWKWVPHPEELDTSRKPDASILCMLRAGLDYYVIADEYRHEFICTGALERLYDELPGYALFNLYLSAKEGAYHCQCTDTSDGFRVRVLGPADGISRNVPWSEVFHAFALFLSSALNLSSDRKLLSYDSPIDFWMEMIEQDPSCTEENTDD